MYRILITDDEKEEREGISFLLEEFQFPLEKAFAANGREALQYLKEHPVDILFTDVRMPVMDGLMLSEEAKKLFPDLKVIIYSGYSEFEYARTAIRIGVSSYILKPVNPDEFCKTVKEVMDSLSEETRTKEKLLVQEAYARKHQLLHRIYYEETDSPKTQAGQESYCRMLLLEFENGFFDSQGIDFEQEILKQAPERTQYLNLNMCQSLLFFPREPDQEVLYMDYFLDCAQKLQFYLQKRYGKKCFIALSNDILPGTGLAPVMRDLEELMEYRFFLPDTYLFHQATVQKKLMEEETAESQVLELIQKDMAVRDFSGLSMHIDLLCDKYEKTSSFSQMYVKFIFSSLYRDMVMQLNGEIEEKQLNQTIDRLYRSTDIREIANLIRDTSLRLKALWAKPIGSSQEVDMVKDYIAEHYAEDLDLVSLAEKVYLSPRYLSTLFKKAEGCGINRYIKTVRMEKARELLENTNIKVVDLCEAVGFCNLSYFCQNFREFYGETPEKYRKSDYYRTKSKKQ